MYCVRRGGYVHGLERYTALGESVMYRVLLGLLR